MKYIPRHYDHPQKNRKLHPLLPNDFDRTPYIYFLINDNVILYIGQTRNLRTRIIHHSNIEYNAIRFIKCNKPDMSYYERRWIRKFKPIYNKNLVNSTKQVNSKDPIETKKVGAKPKHAFNSLKLGEKAILKGSAKKYPHQFIYQYNKTHKSELLVLVKEEGKFLAQRVK